MVMIGYTLTALATIGLVTFLAREMIEGNPKQGSDLNSPSDVLPYISKHDSVDYGDYLDKLADNINSTPGLTWKSKKYNRYHHHTSSDIIHRTGGAKYMPFDARPRIKTEFQVKLGDIPESFDAREKWPKCQSIKEIRDQGDCGGCYAVSAGATWSDRVCIHSPNQDDQRKFSAQDLLECCSLGMTSGCSGGFVANVWTYIKNFGIATGDSYEDQTLCKPFAYPPCSHYVKVASVNPLCTGKPVKTAKCAEKCSGKEYKGVDYDKNLMRANDTYKISGEENMLKEIYESGPIETTIFLYDDLLTYKEGIYTQSKDAKYLSNHAIKIIGFGVENGVKYWLISNTWNTTWGEKGFFRIRRGTGEANVETESFSGTPLWAASTDSQVMTEYYADIAKSRQMYREFMGTEFFVKG